MTEIETNIRNGLPVIARGVVCSAEPDVGLMGQWVDELEIFFRHRDNHLEAHIAVSCPTRTTRGSLTSL